MTASGEFGRIRISDIVIGPERIRKEFTPEAIADLAASIAKRGLIHPITIDRESVLRTGERRLRACTSLGWDHIPFQYLDTLDEKELLAIELEENIKRVDLTWQEQVDAMKRFHLLQKDLHDDWTIAQTATELGVAERTVHRYLAVAKEIESGNSRVADAKELSKAVGLTKRIQERRASDEGALLAAVTDAPPPPETPIIRADFHEWAANYEGAPFNLIHCDFPYGINADKFNQTAGDTLGSYADTFKTYSSLCTTLFENRERLMGESAHIIFWFSMQHYDWTLRHLREFFWVDPYPLVWFKSDNKGTLPDPTRGPRRVYEVAFLCSYGDRKILSAVSNVFSGPTERTAGHMSEKSVPMLQHFMKMCVDGNSRVLDPTCGSGSAIRAADGLGAGLVLGLEQDPEHAENAQRAWREYKGA